VSGQVAVVGGPFLDLVFEGLPRLPAPGEEVVGRAMHGVPGGTAVQAIGLARLDVPVSLVSPKAPDLPGRMLEEILEREGIRWVGPPADRTAATAILSTPGGVAMATSQAEGDPTPDDVAAIDPSGVVLSLGRSPLRPPGVAACFVTGTIELDAGVGLPDGGGTDHDVLVVNEAEAVRLTGETTDEAAARALGRRYPTAVVTLGAGGAVGVRRGALARAAAPEVQVADATGAGDLFVAAIVWTATVGLDLEPALAWACLYAGLSVSAPTAYEGARSLGELLAEGGRRGLTPP
jgi:sugar/nucleoside kinase (ribokinase family)